MRIAQPNPHNPHHPPGWGLMGVVPGVLRLEMKRSRPRHFPARSPYLRLAHRLRRATGPRISSPRRTMTEVLPRLRAALTSRGIRDAAAFTERYGVSLRTLTPDAALALVERVPLENLPPPAAIACDDEQVDNWAIVC